MPRKASKTSATVVRTGRGHRTPGEIARLKAAFISHYSDCGRADISCREAGIIYAQPYAWAKTDLAFKTAWDEARQIAAERLEDAAFKRSVQGTKRPLYQRGELVGFVREYSDSLTMFLLKGLRPEKYKDHASVQVTGRDGGPVQHGLSDETAEAIRQKILGVKPK